MRLLWWKNWAWLLWIDIGWKTGILNKNKKNNFLDLKRAKQICINLTEKAKMNYSEKASDKNEVNILFPYK